MKKRFLPLAFGLFLLTPSLANAFSGETDITPLSNKDVLQMVQSHVSEEAIINTIKSSPCTFDTFPTVLREMKRRGVPDAVLQAMIDAPYGPAQKSSSAATADDLGDQPIYHYADQLKQLGYIAPTKVANRTRAPRQNARARSTPRPRTRL
jgi:hypothetical protein